ncbi:MAG: CotH kinase family protein [Clostridia bacterium]
MKDYLTYQMMGYFRGGHAPLQLYPILRSMVKIGDCISPWKGVEEAFLQRNYGSDCGELYKPDSMDMGGGRGNGENFNVEDMKNFFNGDNTAGNEENSAQMPGEGRRPDGDRMPQGGMDFGGQNSADGRGGMGASMGSDDVALIYTDDEYDSYSNILDNAKTDISDRDKDRLISSLKKLNEREDIEAVVNVEEVIRYFVVHNFVLNFDSYTGSMIHNYYLYEENGQLSMIPWDYNLAFGGFQSASDATSLVNYPIDTPVSGEPLTHGRCSPGFLPAKSIRSNIISISLS